MSFKSWCEEFYDEVTVDSCKTELEAVEHCLQKWRGILPQNIDKHKVNKP